MAVYTFSQVRQNFAAVLNKAQQEGEVIIKRKDGSEFVIKPFKRRNKSPLNVKGVNLSISADDIINVIREIRES